MGHQLLGLNMKDFCLSKSRHLPLLTWNKNYLDCKLDHDLDLYLDRDPEDASVYTGHSFFKITKKVIV